jgi:hypothetical protein
LLLCIIPDAALFKPHRVPQHQHRYVPGWRQFRDPARASPTDPDQGLLTRLAGLDTGYGSVNRGHMIG